MSVALPYWTALGVLNSGCWSPGFLSGVGHLEQAGSQKWSCEGLVNEKSPAPSTHRASLWVRNELFSCQFQLAPSFSKVLQCWLSPRGCWVVLPPYGLFQLHVLPLPLRERENITSVYLATRFVQRGCIWLPNCDKICSSLPNSVLHSPCRLADLLG
jgi:hypothetical protein